MVSLFLIASLFFLTGAAVATQGMLVPYLKEVYSLTYSGTVALIAVFYAGFFLLTLLFRGGSCRKGLFLGAFFCGAGSSLIALSYSLPAIACGLFLLGAGIAASQVAGNTMAVFLGGNLIFLQSATCLGMVAAPLFLSAYLFETGLVIPYGLMAFCWFILSFLAKGISDIPFLSKLQKLDRLCYLAFFAVMLSIGIEAAVASHLIPLIAEQSMISYLAAAKWASLFWFALFLGRLLASFISIPPLRLAAYFALAGLALALFVVLGVMPTFSAIALGLAISLFFPLIFSYAIKRRPHISGLLCMGNIGGAILPFVQGTAADTFSLQASFAIPVAGFASLLFLFRLLKQEGAAEMQQEPLNL